MTKPYHLFLDQYGQHVWARTVKELQQKAGSGKVSRLYSDKMDGGGGVHSGYAVGRRWFTRYAPVETRIK